MKNLSAKGLFVITKVPPPIESVVDLEMDLGSSGGGSSVMIQAKGRVRRVEMTDVLGRPGGFAASTRSMKLRKASGRV